MEVMPGYKQTEAGAIPEDWEARPVGDNIDLLTGFPFPSSGYTDYGVRLLRGSNVKRGVTDWSEEITQYWPEITSSIAHYKLQAGDLVIAMDGSLVGRSSAMLKESDLPALLLQRVARLRSTKRIDTSYLAAFIGGDWFVKHADSVKTVTAIPHISPADIRSFIIPVPPTLEEQRAIATALSDVDALLDGLTRLIAKKRDLKQATMQQLLTGQTRLPGFSEQWVERTIGQLAEVGRGRVISHREISKSTNPKYPVFSSQTSNDGIMGYLDTYDFEGEYVTWTTDGANAGTIFARSGRFNCTNVCGTIKPYTGDCRFIAAALGRVSKPHVSRHLGNPKLMNDVMKRINIRIPFSVAEQTAIANVISDMDAELTALEGRLTKTRALKQAMMSELLTGKTRLPT